MHMRALPFERRRRCQVGLAGIQPPAVNAFPEQLSFDLGPEHSPSFGAEGIVEGIRVADPIMDTLTQIRFVEKSAGMEILEIFGAGVELGPHRDNHMGAIFVVNGAYPPWGSGKRAGSNW
jgi:hypothetical protein